MNQDLYIYIILYSNILTRKSLSSLLSVWKQMCLRLDFTFKPYDKGEKKGREKEIVIPTYSAACAYTKGYTLIQYY